MLSISEDLGKNFLQEKLKEEGYSVEVSPSAHSKKGVNNRGVDVLAISDKEVLLIEVIGRRSTPTNCSVAFDVNFQRCSNKLNLAPKYPDLKIQIVFAMPSSYLKGLPQRIQEWSVTGWLRIGQAFPELQLWIFDLDSKTIFKKAWSDWYED